MDPAHTPTPEEWARKQKKLERLERWERRMDQNHRENTEAVRIHMAWCLANAVLLVLPLLGRNWAWCQFYGFGLGSMWVQVSLTHFSADITCMKNFLEDAICKVAAKAAGKHTLAEAYQLFCQPYFAPAACEAATTLYWSSYVIMFANVVACTLQLLAAAFLWYYWTYAHLRRIKSWSVTFMFSSLLIAACGLMLWTALCPQLSTLPQIWTNTAFGLSGMHLFSIKANSAFIQYGTAWALDVGGIVMMMFSLGYFSCVVHSHEDEAAADLLETLSMEHARDEAAASALGFDYYGQQPVVPLGTASW